MPMVSQPPIEIAELAVGQAEELDEDADERIADAEDAGDEAGLLQRAEMV